MTFTTATVSSAARSRVPPPASSAARRAASSIRTSGSRPPAGSAGRSIGWPALTRKPFAVDLLAPLPQMIVPYLPILYEEEVEIFVAGLAVPEQHVAAMKAHGMKIMVMTGKVKHAVRAEQAGADVVAAQGTEA